MKYQHFPWKRGSGFRKFWPEAEMLGIFSIEVAPISISKHTENTLKSYLF